MQCEAREDQLSVLKGFLPRLTNTNLGSNEIERIEKLIEEVLSSRTKDLELVRLAVQTKAKIVGMQAILQFGGCGDPIPCMMNSFVKNYADRGLIDPSVSVHFLFEKECGNEGCVYAFSVSSESRAKAEARWNSCPADIDDIISLC